MQNAALLLKQAAAKYLLAAMATWVPTQNHYLRDKAGHFLRTPLGFVQEDQAIARARYEATASDVAEIAFDPQNEPVYRGADGRLKTALLLMSLGSFEGGFQAWVDDGSCNTPEFQKRAKEQHRVECDGGAAFSIWQIHPEAGYAVKDGQLTLLRFLPHGYALAHSDDVVTGEKLARDRRYAAQIAYYLVRYSEHQYHSLCAYTGESCLGAHPLSDRREGRAKDYLARHPFEPPTEAEIAAALTLNP
jgi:hypothetical protein